MNQTAIRKVPEEWTPDMWQAHVCEMEKRISTLENSIANMGDTFKKEALEIVERKRREGACLV